MDRTRRPAPPSPLPRPRDGHSPDGGPGGGESARRRAHRGEELRATARRSRSGGGGVFERPGFADPAAGRVEQLGQVHRLAVAAVELLDLGAAAEPAVSAEHPSPCPPSISNSSRARLRLACFSSRVTWPRPVRRGTSPKRPTSPSRASPAIAASRGRRALRAQAAGGRIARCGRGRGLPPRRRLGRPADDPAPAEHRGADAAPAAQGTQAEGAVAAGHHGPPRGGRARPAGGSGVGRGARARLRGSSPSPDAARPSGNRQVRGASSADAPSSEMRW